MATPENKTVALESMLEKVVEYEPFQSKDKIQLSAQMVMKLLCKPTKSGKQCSMDQAIKFVMLCKTRGLNPWEGDAFIVGYDTQDGPEFNLITAHQAFLKRAEVNPEFEGMESGVIVQLKDGSLVEMPGDFFDDNQHLKGAWAKIFLKNRPNHPVYKRLRFDSFNKGFGRWKQDPGGMIVKCAEADALRTAFPNTLGGMYLESEMGHETDGLPSVPAQLPGNSAVAALEEKIAVPTALENKLTESANVVTEKKREKKKEKAIEPETKPEVVADTAEPDGENVTEIAHEAAAKVETQPEPTKEPAKQAAPAAGGIELRGVTFPVELKAGEAFPKHTKVQMDKAVAEATRIGIDLDKFSQKRLKVPVGELNEAAMEKLIELLKNVSN